MSLLKDGFVIDGRVLLLEDKIRYRQIRKDKHFKENINNTHTCTGIYLLCLGVPLSAILCYTCSI